MTVIMKDRGCTASTIGFYLMVVGALNWGLVGLGSFFGGDWNLVSKLLGSWPMVENVVYVLVGLSAVMSVVGCKCSTCKACKVDAPQQM